MSLKTLRILGITPLMNSSTSSIVIDLTVISDVQNNGSLNFLESVSQISLSDFIFVLSPSSSRTSEIVFLYKVDQ